MEIVQDYIMAGRAFVVAKARGRGSRLAGFDAPFNMGER